MQPFTVKIPISLALTWCRFEIEDIDLFKFPVTQWEHGALFYGQIYGLLGVRGMLVESGEALLHRNVEAFVYRTSNPIVLGWSIKYGAQSWHKKGHRPRFYLDGVEWKKLCIRASSRYSR